MDTDGKGVEGYGVVLDWKLEGIAIQSPRGGGNLYPGSFTNTENRHRCVPAQSGKNVCEIVFGRRIQ